MGLDSHIKNFEEDFNTKLSEREKIIFGYAYSLINNKNDDIVSENIFVTVSQRNHYSLRDKCKSLAKDYGLKCDVEYIDMMFSFPWNRVKYKIGITGKLKSIESFKGSLDNIL